MERLVQLIAEHPECFGDGVYLPCGLREFVDLLNESTVYRPLVKHATGPGISDSGTSSSFPSSVQLTLRG
jgi:hypothetical protein